MLKQRSWLIIVSLVLTLGGLLIGGSAEAQANQQNELGQFKDWSAFKVVSGGVTICFAVSKPLKSLPEGVNRDPTYFFVTTRPGDNTVNETSIEIGYPFKEGSNVTVAIDGQGYEFYTDKNNAWITDIRSEEAFVSKMRSGSKMVVKGTSARGTNTTDEYSLLGITAALKSVADDCK